MNKPIREGFVAEPIENEETTKLTDDVALESASIESAREQWPVKVKLLHRPIRGMKGEEVRELTFREPAGADINRYGNPVRINQEGDVVIDERKMTFMMAGLSGILSPLLERMDPRDWNSCAYRLRGFFLPQMEAWL